MEYSVILLPINDYIPEEVCSKDIPEKHLLDESDNLCLAYALAKSENFVSQLLNFIFNGKQITKEVYRNQYGYLLDLTLSKPHLVDFDYLEKNYERWLEETGRENSMSEYGTLIDFIGFSKNGINKKHLLLIVSNET